jgi:putative alpha-1,2-mannosidase
MSFCKGYTQGGSNADTLLADSYVKGIRTGINWTDGLQAMLDDAEITPPAWNYEGRGAIKQRKQYGYIPIEDGAALKRSVDGEDDEHLPQQRLWNVMEGKIVSRHLEYAYNDASIALVAAGEGKMDLYEDFKNRSGDWRNIWQANLTADGQTGFFQGRRRDGSWGDQSPSKCSPREGLGCYTFDRTAYAYEASLHQYSFYAPAGECRLAQNFP